MTRVLLQENIGSSLVLTINREAQRNALSGEVASALLTRIVDANSDTTIRSIIFQGAGESAFSSGADIKERAAANAAEKWQLSRNLLAVNRALLESPKISYAAINGWCLGGGFELALACDFRISATSGKFGWPEVKLGAYPGAGAAVLLPRLVGVQVAKRFLLSTRNINANEALELGVIDAITEKAPIEACLERANELVDVAPQAQAAIKASLQNTSHLSLAEAFDVDAEFRKPLEGSNDYQEGIKAFFEKRRPNYTGT